MSEPQAGLPRATYWWRRVSIGLVLVAVVVLAVVLSRLGSGGSSPASSTSSVTPKTTASTSPHATVTPTAPATTTPAATTPATNAAVTTCSPANVSVVVKPATRTFPGAATFTTTATNTGAACTLPSGLQLVVTSGQDRIWSNVDCTPASAGGAEAVAAGKSVAAARSWDRARSRPACATVIGTKTAGAGVYHVTATWGGLTSSTAIFSLS